VDLTTAGEAEIAHVRLAEIVFVTEIKASLEDSGKKKKE